MQVLIFVLLTTEKKKGIYKDWKVVNEGYIKSAIIIKIFF